MATVATSCECRFDRGGVVTDLCEEHYRVYMIQVERRMTCSSGRCGE